MNTPKELPRKLGLLDATTIIIGTVIGSGIFLTPSFIARTVGSPGLMVLVWIVGGLLSLCGALTYAELGVLRPSSGGQYVFLRDAFGPLTGFLYGWSAFLIIHTGTLSAVAVAFSLYLQQFFPLSMFGARFAAVSFIAGLTVINCVGVEPSKWFQNVTTFLKVGALAALVGASFVLSRHSATTFRPFLPEHFTLHTLGSFGMAMMGALFAYEGWSFVTYTAGEIRNPRRYLPLSMILGTLSLILIYSLTNFSYMLHLTPVEMGASDRVAAASAEHMFGQAGGSLISGMIVLCLIGATNGVVLTGPRIIYAMSRDRLFFEKLSEVHPRFETPVWAIASQGIWASVLAITGTYERLFTFVLLGAWIFYALTGATIFIYRRNIQDIQAQPENYQVWGYPVVPGLFVVTALFLVGNTILHSPKDSLICVGLIMLGLPAYYYWKARKQVPLT